MFSASSRPRATEGTAASAPNGTIVTIDAGGYELFTFHGLPLARLSVPLRRSGVPDALLQGTVSSSNSNLPGFTRYVGDTRIALDGDPLVPVQSCSFNPSLGLYQCGYGTAPIRSGPLGAASLLVVEPPQTSFDPFRFLRAFDTASGEELWRGRLPAAGHATPMTYRLSSQGRQYVVVAAGGHGILGSAVGDSVVAFALPKR